jgi:acetyl-CoA/propionyl-CoA carboxylase biotin carboxyl carrier protein
VLIANRGEIAVRVVRACRDAGLVSVAVYADQDREAPHVRAADEAYALGGTTADQTYLDAGALLEAAARSGADAVHPGYGFLSENAGFAEAVAAAGLVWIGPPAAAIRALGDKVAARRIARRVGAPLAAGTPGPVSGADEVAAFARAHGLPVAIKAALGGGGRGMKVARTMEEIPELYEAAVREAVAAFGSGVCFAEQYLERPRHVETQCLADAYGNVAVLSTRDCSLQRRHQKLVEEAPAPFLTPEQHDAIVAASKAILREAGYVSAGTCEFLVGQEGTVSFLEVNTRLQVEHPVTEEVTGIDLVREMLRIAEGEELGYTDPPVRGHAIEFRVNCEDPGRGFLPAPGPVTAWRPPGGPGVRTDSGVEAGTVVDPGFDSMLAKLVVTGRDRTQALERARRALAEFEVAGLPTTLPFHRAVVADPAFAPEDPGVPFAVHTRWIETEFSDAIPPQAQPAPDAAGAADRTRQVTVEADGRRLVVRLPADLITPAPAGRGARPGPRARRTARNPAAGNGNGGGGGEGSALCAPMQGTVVKVVAEDGRQVQAGDLIVVLEAMKMEQPVRAHRAGVVRNLAVAAAATVLAGAVICDITSP